MIPEPTVGSTIRFTRGHYTYICHRFEDGWYTTSTIDGEYDPDEDQHFLGKVETWASIISFTEQWWAPVPIEVATIWKGLIELPSG